MRLRQTSTLLCLCGLGLVSSCQGRCEPEADACQPSCPDGFLCEASSSRCIAASLPLFASPEVPGRAARLSGAQGGYLAAVIDPVERSVLTSFRTTSGREWIWRVLSTSVRAGSSHLALASSSQQNVVVWIDQEGFFQLATRQASLGEDAWSTETVRLPANDGSMGPTYSATDDFDVSLDERGEPYLVFRDRSTNALSLFERGAQATWQLSEIDDGTRSETLEDCPLEVQESRRRGMGYEPDILSRTQNLAVAYHDANCGDLRLARRVAGGAWRVEVLDRGERAPLEDHITGRYPSLALDERGALAVAYMDQSFGRLMYGTFRSDGFTRQVVDEGLGLAASSQRPKKVVGAFARLSFDASGRPQVTYLDGSSLDAVVATTTGAPDASSGRYDWQQRVVASQGATGFFLDHVRVVNEDALLCIMESLSPGESGMRSEVQIVEQEL